MGGTPMPPAEALCPLHSRFRKPVQGETLPGEYEGVSPSENSPSSVCGAKQRESDAQPIRQSGTERLKPYDALESGLELRERI